MPDVISYASTGVVTYKQGTAVAYADKFGNTSKITARVLPSVQTNVVVSQSGILDGRFDNPTYYSA
jgi:hypothetical protein